MAKTSIAIDVSTWDKLNRMKKVGDSFDDLINQLLKETGRGESQ